MKCNDFDMMEELRKEFLNKLGSKNRSYYEIVGNDYIPTKEPTMEAMSDKFDDGSLKRDCVNQQYNIYYCVSNLYKAHFGLDFRMVDLGSPKSKTVVFDKEFDLNIQDRISKTEFNVKLHIGKVEFSKGEPDPKIGLEYQDILEAKLKITLELFYKGVQLTKAYFGYPLKLQYIITEFGDRMQPSYVIKDTGSLLHYYIVSLIQEV